MTPAKPGRPSSHQGRTHRANEGTANGVHTRTGGKEEEPSAVIALPRTSSKKAASGATMESSRVSGSPVARHARVHRTHDDTVDSTPASPAQPVLSRSGREVLGQSVSVPDDKRVVSSPVDAVRGLLGKTSQQHPDHTASGDSLPIAASGPGKQAKPTVDAAPLGVDGPRRVLPQDEPTDETEGASLMSPVTRFVNGIASALAKRRKASVAPQHRHGGASQIQEPDEANASSFEKSGAEMRGHQQPIHEETGTGRVEDENSLQEPLEDIKDDTIDEKDTSDVTGDVTAPPSAEMPGQSVAKSLAIIVERARNGRARRATDSEGAHSSTGGGHIDQLSPIARHAPSPAPAPT